MKKFSILLLLAFALCLVSVTDTQAQCAMCQATVESNVDGGGDVANNLNNGIMYLLAAPYLLVAGIGFLWYKKYRKKDIIVDVKSEKINLN